MISFLILYANFLIVIESPLPTLKIGTLFFEALINFFLGKLKTCNIASAKSSTNKNSLVGFPLPHTFILLLLFLALKNFEINPGLPLSIIQ